MTPKTHPELFALLERGVIALEKLAAASSGAGRAESSGGLRAMKVPSWAKFDKGIPLGEITEKSLAWWVGSYVPKPFEKRDGTVTPPAAADVRLRKALDEAAKELGLPMPEGYEPASEAPTPTPKPTVPPQDNTDEDVPF